MAGGPWANPLFSGDGPNGQALPYCGTCSSLRGAFGVLPVAELLVVDARTSAASPKEYQEYLAGREHISPCKEFGAENRNGAFDPAFDFADRKRV
jgi:hypothetical protein